MHKYLLLTLVMMAPAFGQNTAVELRAAAGCGPMKTEFSVKADKKQHPNPGRRWFMFFLNMSRTLRQPTSGM